MEKETIEIRKDKLQELYKILTHYPVISKEQVDSEMCKVFGVDVLKKPIDVLERVKTFDDACRELGEYHPFVKEFNDICCDIRPMDKGGLTKDLFAYLKLRIVCAALNEGWEPQFTEDEERYYPWCWLYTKKEIEQMGEDERKERNMVSTVGYQTEYAGFAYAASINAPSYSNSDIGTRLCLKSDTLAAYCGKQFTDIWADFMLIRKGGGL